MKETGSIHARPPAAEGRFKALLLALTCLTLAPYLVYCARVPLDFDGFTHVFIAVQDDLRHLMTQEWRHDAHPFLHYALLGTMTRLGRGRLCYRLFSLLPGVASVYVLGLAARRVYAGKAAALLAAAAYGFSLTMLVINCDVRGYPLALFFIILAFYHFAGFMDDPRGVGAPGALASFGAFVALALCAEYYALLFFAACLGTAALKAALRRDFAGELVAAARAAPGAAAAALGAPLTTLLVLWLVHLRYQPSWEGHLAAFYWDEKSSLLSFWLAALKNDVNFLLPVAIRSTGALAALIASAAAFSVLAFRGRSGGTRSLPAAVALLLTLELAALGALRRYPFGGYERQQSVLFPFYVLAAFAVLDFALSRLESLPRRALALLAAGVIGANFHDGWRWVAYAAEPPFGYEGCSLAIPATGVLVVDRYSLIKLFSETDAWNWHFKTSVRWRDLSLHEYELAGPSGERVLVIADEDTWDFDLRGAETYDMLAFVLDETRVKSADLLYVQCRDGADGAGIASFRGRVMALASAGGLRAVPLTFENGYADIRFERSIEKRRRGF